VTIVAAYVDPTGRTAIGSDSQAVQGDYKIEVAHKLVRRGAAVIGLAGAALWRRFLEEDAPEMTGPDDIGRLSDAWMEWADLRGHGETLDGQRLQNGTLLVAFPGRLMTIDPDGAVTESRHHYAAIGTGHGVALGVLAMSSTTDVLAEMAVGAALRVACMHVVGCGGPLHVEVV